MSKLKIYKVNSLPSTLEANALYFIRQYGQFPIDQPGNYNLQIYLTDNLGNVLYRTYDYDDINEIIIEYIHYKLNVNNGIASIASNGIIDRVSESLVNYSHELIATTDGQQTFTLSKKINPFTHSLYINGLKQPNGYNYNNDKTIVIPETYEIKIGDEIHFDYNIGIAERV